MPALLQSPQQDIGFSLFPSITARYLLIFLQCHRQSVPQLHCWLWDNVCQGFPVLPILRAVSFL